jgi:hypothetical protein
VTWRDLAACRGVPAEVFYLPRADFWRGPSEQYLANAARVMAAYCDRCPVREQCLAAAIDEEVADLERTDGALRRNARPHVDGIRGGMTPHERANIVAERAGLPWRAQPPRPRLVCSVADCRNAHHGRGLCRKHLKHLARGSLQMQREVS